MKQNSITDLLFGHPSRRWNVCLSLLVLAWGALTTPRAVAADPTLIQYQFTRILLTNSAGDTANKINNRGEITGTVDGTDGVSRGYLYADGKERERSGWTGSSFTEWEGMNASGELSGYYADPGDPKGNTYRAFIRKPDGTFLPIGWPGDTNFNFTVDINRSGQVAGGSSAQGWVRNTNNTYAVFKTPGYQTSGAWGLNDAGLAVGVAFTGFFDVANGLIYDTKADTFQIWNYPGAAQTTLYGINNRGDIVGGFKQTVASAEVPFIRWIDGSTQVLTFAEESNVRVYGINDTRVIVGRYQDANKVSHSFLASPIHTVDHLLVANQFGGEIVQFGANGREGIFAKDGLKAPGAVIAGPDGNIYVSDYTRSVVVRYAADGAPLGTFASDGLDAPLGMLFDTSGNLLVVNYAGQNVVKIAPNGTRSAFITNGLDGPVAIVRAANGEFLVSNSVGNNIRRYSATGANLGILTTNVSVPIGLAHDASGVLYVANAVGSTIGKFATNGASLGNFPAANLDGPTGLAFASNGDLYVANAFAGNVRRYSSTGADLGVVGTGFNFPYLLAFAHTQPILDAVHADAGIDYEDGVWNVHLHDETHDIEYAPGGAVIQVSEAARTLVPQDARFRFLGAAGDPLWLLPQVQNEKVTYLGMAADGVTDGVMRDNKVKFTLVSFSGPGHFVLYGVDGFGSPVVFMNTRDGVSPAGDFRELLTGGHEDRNWAFTAPGVYRIGLQASGVLASNGQAVQSPVVTYTFQVLTGTPPPAPPRFTYQTFDLPGAKETLIADLDNNGRLVGRYKDANDLSHGFFLSGTNVIKFNVTGNTATFATGFDAAGRIVGFYRDKVNPDVQHGFLRNTNGTFVTIDSPANTTTTYLWRLNDAGQINGYHFEDEPFFIRSFRRASNGSFTTNIVFPGSPLGTVTRGMNEAGVLTGWKWDDNFNLQGVIVEGTNFTSVFTVPDWANTLPGDINNRGEIAGTVINAEFTDRRGFFRTSDGRTSVFAPPGATETEVFGLNDNGLIVGEYVDQAGKRHGFIASPAIGLDKGHTDVGIAFENGEWDLHIHHEVTDIEYAPDKAVLQFGAASEQFISDALDFRFLGDAGRSTWILPQVENANLLFLGLAAEEIKDGVFVNNTLRVELVSVDGPGNFFVWTADPLGHPQLHFNSADGILSSQDFYSLRTGGHQDMNWAFSAPGTYRVGYRVSGTLIAGNQFKQSDAAYYTFEVPAALLPQPPQPDHSTFTYHTLAVAGADRTQFYKANDANVIVGFARDAASGHRHGLIYTNGGYALFDYPGAVSTVAVDINNTGRIVGYYERADGTVRGFSRLGTNYTSHALPGEASTTLWSINDAGLAVGDNYDSTTFLLNLALPAPTPSVFPGPNGTTHYLGGVNNRGQVFGGYDIGGGRFAGFVREPNGTFSLTNYVHFDSAETFIDDVTDDGRLLVFIHRGEQFGTLIQETNGVTRPVLLPLIGDVVGWGLNETGLITGYYSTGNGNRNAFAATPATRLTSGHTDIGALYTTNGWELEVHAESLEKEFEPGAALLQLPALTQTTVPTNAAFAFLGAAGAPVWVLPQVQHPKLLFLGLAAEEIEKGIFANDEIKFTLKKVEGPGHFFLYAVDGFRSPVIYWNTRDGLSASDARTIVAGGHEDLNWAFTAPGYYRVTLEASGTLANGNRFTTSGDVTYHIEVVGIDTQLSLTRTDATNLALTVTTEDGIIYQLQSAAKVNGPWSDVGQPFIGTGRDKQFSVPLGGGAGFYRVQSNTGN